MKGKRREVKMMIAVFELADLNAPYPAADVCFYLSERRSSTPTNEETNTPKTRPASGDDSA